LEKTLALVGTTAKKEVDHIKRFPRGRNSVGGDPARPKEKEYKICDSKGIQRSRGKMRLEGRVGARDEP